MDKLIISEMPLSELKWVSHLAAGPGSTVMPHLRGRACGKRCLLPVPAGGKACVFLTLNNPGSFYICQVLARHQEAAEL